MNKKYLNLVFILVALLVGLYIGLYYGPLLVSDKLPSYYGCNQIARWHQDYLMREYGIHDGFNTNTENPRREFNQKASDLNSMILALCFTDPSNIKPGLKQMIDEQSYPR